MLAIFDKPDPLDEPFFEETLYVTPSRLPVDIQNEITSCAARTAEMLGLREDLSTQSCELMPMARG